MSSISSQLCFLHFSWLSLPTIILIPCTVPLSLSDLAVPRKPDFSLDVDRIVEVVEQEKPKCIFLTSPNNPDGR